MGQQHGQAEQAVKASGLTWHILQPQAFMQNWLGEVATTVRTEGKLYEAAGEGRKPFLDARDIAEVAFTLLTQPERFASQTFRLSGGEALSYYQVADALTQATGTPVTYVAQTPDEARQRLLAKGLPAWLIDTVLGIALDQRAGTAERALTTDVQTILGKLPRTVYDFAREYRAAFMP